MAGPGDKNIKTDNAGKVDTRSNGLEELKTDISALPKTDRPLTDEQEQQLKKELEEKTLKEMMEMQKEAKRRTDEAKHVLERANAGDLSALGPYSGQHHHNKKTIIHEDNEKMEALKNTGGRREAGFVAGIKAGAEPDKEVARMQKILDESLPNAKAKALLVHDTEGNTLVGVVGISVQEFDAVLDLKKQQSREQAKSDIITTKIQDKIKEGPQKQAYADDHSIGAPPARAVTRDPSARQI